MSVLRLSCVGAHHDRIITSVLDRSSRKRRDAGFCAESRDATAGPFWRRQHIARVTDTEPSRPELRELTYGYRTKTDADGRPLRLGPMIMDSRDAARVLSDLLSHEAIEVFGMLCLTAKYHVICWHEVTRGCLDRTFVHPREVFKPAIMANAAAIVVGHNHPSGDPDPSPGDFEVTTQLMAAGRLLGLAVIDHVIVGNDSFVSLRNVEPAARGYKTLGETADRVNRARDSQKLAVSA